MSRRAEASGPTETSALEVFAVDDIVGYRRSPSDVVRLILFGLATIALLALTRWGESTVRAFESDVVALFGGLNRSVEQTLSQTLSVAAGIVSLAVYVPPVLLKRYRLIGYILVANIVTALLVAVATWWLDQAAARSLLTTVVDRIGVDLAGFAHAVDARATGVVVRDPRAVRRPAVAPGRHGDPRDLRARPHRARDRAAHRDLPRRRDRCHGRDRRAPRVRPSRSPADGGRGHGRARVERVDHGHARAVCARRARRAVVRRDRHR